MQNKISVIIVNYNGQNWLSQCLPDLLDQTYKNYEVIVVDNNSTDGSKSFIKTHYPKIKLVELEKNYGFAKANNVGFKFSTGKYILLLNNDTQFEKTYLADFVDVFTKIPNCSIAQSQILKLSNPQIIDSCGGQFTPSSFLYYVGNDKNVNNKLYKDPFVVFSVKGASMIIKRQVIEEIGLFNEHFWSYYEESDFCHRAWISGNEVWYWPKAKVLHAVGGTSLKFPNDLVQFHNFKNKLFSLMVNLEKEWAIVILPVYLFWVIIIAIFWTLQLKFGHVLAMVKSIIWNVQNWRLVKKTRNQVQKIRRVSDGYIFSRVFKDPKIDYYPKLLLNRLSEYAD